MIPLAIPVLEGNERKYLNECIDTGFVSTVGEFVNRFEVDVAKATGAKKAVAVNSGTSALHLCLVGVGVKRDDLVITQDLTFIATANAITYCGAEPLLVDVEEESWCMDPDSLRKVLQIECEKKNNEVIHKGTGRRVSAVLPVYTLGCPAQMDEIKKVASEFKLPVVADAAAAIGATYKDRPLSELATLSALSFNGNKTMTSGGGGAIIGNDDKLMSHLKHISTTARRGPDYIFDEIGYNYRMTNVEAAIGCAQLEQLDAFVAKKSEIYRYYAENLSLPAFPSPNWCKSAHWFSGVLLESGDQVKEMIKEMGNEGVMVRPFWVPLHLQPKFKKCPKVDTPVSAFIWEKILVLPCSTNLSNDEQQKVVDTLSSLLNL